MSRVVLSRLWYIFPPDDQNLQPEQFARKVGSYVRTLALAEQRMLLQFLVVQYDAFQKQLELLFGHGSVAEHEYHERAQRLERYLDHLHGFLRSIGQCGAAREASDRMRSRARVGAPAGDAGRDDVRSHSLRRQPQVAGPHT
jgi:hypothetical protein